MDSKSLITDEIVELGARADFRYSSDFDERWEDLSPEYQADLKGDMRAALEAVAHLIAARALEETAQAWQRGEWADAPRSAEPIRERLDTAQYVTDWLRHRARVQVNQN